LTNQIQDALGLIYQLTDEQALIFYHILLTIYPYHYFSYTLCSQLLKHNQDKTHLLLKGALHAIQNNEINEAEKLCLEAEKHKSLNLIDYLLHLELLHDSSLITQKLGAIADVINTEIEKSGDDLEGKKKNLKQVLKVYKYLDILNETVDNNEKIIAVYKELSKLNKLTRWYINSLNLLLASRNWAKAEQLAYEAINNALQKGYENATTKDIVVIYQKLDIIYDNFEQSSQKRADVLERLGRALLNDSQLEAAEKIFRKAHSLFGSVEQAFSLAEALSQQNKIGEAVMLYYETSSLALAKSEFVQLQKCVESIKRIDPTLNILDVQKRTNLFTQSTMIQLVTSLDEAKKEIQTLKEKVDKLEKA
jgi:tetratricopeptide (TPR) repeat protein